MQKHEVEEEEDFFQQQCQTRSAFILDLQLITQLLWQLWLQWNTDKRITLGTQILICLTVRSTQLFWFKSKKSILVPVLFDPVYHLIYLSSDLLISISLYVQWNTDKWITG